MVERLLENGSAYICQGDDIEEDIRNEEDVYNEVHPGYDQINKERLILFSIINFAFLSVVDVIAPR